MSEIDFQPSNGVRTISFGSCNRQNRPQQHWQTIASLNPSYFLWTGDAIYAKGGVNVSNVHRTYKNLTDNESYRDFKSRIRIDGVWDDHDYGVNDGGRDVPDRPQRQDEFLRFLQHGQPTSDSEHLSILSGQDGLYHSIDVRLENGLTLKVLFLDTRSHRDPHWLRSLGEYEVKGSALVASALRASYTLMGLGRQYKGQMLGEQQWQWLEETLNTSAADYHAIVSSIQVLTINPVTESWGHFPIEQERLMHLLQRTDPRGLFFISGDVHLAEMSAAFYKRADGSSGQWVEVTSSGLTHTCADGMINSFLCPLMTSLFSLHRRNAESLFIGRNFGIIESSQLSHAGSSSGSIDQQMLQDGKSRWVDLKIQSLHPDSLITEEVMSHRLYSEATSSAIEHVQYPHLAVLPEALRRFFLTALVALLYVYIVRARMRRSAGARFDLWGRRTDSNSSRRRRKFAKTE